MTAQSSKSMILAQMKNKSKGGFASAREKAKDAKPRGGGGLPPNIKNAVAVCCNYKLAKASNGNPYFSLTGIIKEPDDLEGRRVTIMWFMAESDYNTYEEAEEALTNDLALLNGGTPPDDVEDYDNVLDWLKTLCEDGVHFLFNTGRERKGGKAPNPYIVGLADGWEDDPHKDAGEAAERPQRGAPASHTAPATTTNGQTRRGPTRHTKQEPEPEAEQEAPADDQVEVVAEEEGEEAMYVPQIDDEYDYTPKGGKKDAYLITKVNEEKDVVDLKQKKAAKGKSPLAFKNVPFAKLGV